MLFAANGNEIRVTGKVSITVKMGGLCVPYDFLVVEDLSQNLILGVDFFQSTKALINYADKTVTFFDDLVELNILSRKRISLLV